MKICLVIEALYVILHVKCLLSLLDVKVIRDYIDKY